MDAELREQMLMDRPDTLFGGKDMLEETKRPFAVSVAQSRHTECEPGAQLMFEFVFPRVTALDAIAGWLRFEIPQRNGENARLRLEIIAKGGRAHRPDIASRLIGTVERLDEITVSVIPYEPVPLKSTVAASRTRGMNADESSGVHRSSPALHCKVRQRRHTPFPTACKRVSAPCAP